MKDQVLEIDYDKKCAECGKMGATESNICLKCVTKAMDLNRRMKSRAGKIVQMRIWDQRHTKKTSGEANG